MARMVRVSARAQILLTALLISTGGTAIKAVALTNWQIASIRSGIAALVLALGVRRIRGFSRDTLVVGAAYAAMMITFVSANKLTTAANTVFLQGTAPLYVALLGPWILKEHFRHRDIPVLAAIACGILLLFAGSPNASATAPNRALGNVVGVVSGFCWGLTVMGLRWVEKRNPSARGDAAGAAAITGNVIACLACLPLAWPISHPAAFDVVGVAYLGIFQVGLALLLLTRAIRHVPAVDASLLLLVEPAFSPLWAWIVHREAPGAWPLIGGVLIVGAATWKTWRDAHVP
jgi:drug/metabolite transporter (DMT)-like permease